MKFFVILLFPFLLQSNSFHSNDKFITYSVPYAGRTIGETVCEDLCLVKRIVNAYQLANKYSLGNSMWQVFYEQRLHGIHEIFQSGNLTSTTRILRNPNESDLFFGIDSLCFSLLPSQISNQNMVFLANCCIDSLLRCGEAIGAVKLHNPENPYVSCKKWSANDILSSIEDFLKIQVFFPNPYADEIGICTTNGIASIRAINALYQAYLIKELVKGIPSPRILEIGAGLGRTAYYCKQLGITDYTIIDIPMTALASSYFLGRTLGEEQIVLLGEDPEASQNKVKIFTPEQFLKDRSKYDLIINVDSLTEMDPSTINGYLSKIRELTSTFVSINHEDNTHSVFELLSSSPKIKSFQRYPYWMRNGYVEELYIFKQE